MFGVERCKFTQLDIALMVVPDLLNSCHCDTVLIFVFFM